MKTKFFLFLLLGVAIFSGIACEKAHSDYRIISKWYGTYECQKNTHFSSYFPYDIDVVVDILPVDEDSSVYVRERTIYDLNAQYYEEEAKFKAKIDIDGFFYGVKTEKYYSCVNNYYFEGCISNDSLFMKMYNGYDTKPADSIAAFSTYKGKRIIEKR